MKIESTPSPLKTRKRGRPLSFDRDQATQQAMLLFWEHGYEATSLSDLTTALKVPPSSIYSAFGDKKGLFLAAVQRYVAGPVNSESIIREAATGRDAASGLLRAAAIGFTGTATPRGCLLASSAISCSAAAQDVKKALADVRRAVEASLRDKVRRSVKEGSLPSETDPAALAAHTMAVIQGMSTLARDGATRASLLRIADTAMNCWPVPSGGRARLKAASARRPRGHLTARAPETG
jgi:AcrR family transcriptional regulator